ncbi:hypothetical protein HY440_01290 [Candidatus Microgenomates bacterium]|nr:hypothetical protein [Candidatus Microgenomates bacterium]
MRTIEGFLHFFTPRHTNNHKARALHPSSLSIYIGLLLVFQIILTGVSHFQPQILGYASNISVADLLFQTNSKRAAAGVGTLALNGQLNAAAAAKATDMFANQYWAHTSPAGRDPWSFITGAGYSYLFAGENLARDFGDSSAVVSAWMNSATHRENLLNPRYKDIGFAIVNGKYGNHETTLVVQEFGARAGAAPSVAAPQIAPVAPPPVASPPAEQPKPVTATPPGEILNLETPKFSPPKFDPFTLTRNVSFGLIAMLMAVLVVDGILVYKRRIVRLSGHNLAHLLMLLAVLAALNLIGRGVIL